MKHQIVAERFGVRLRPVTMDDAQYIYQLRTTPELTRFIGEISDAYDVHIAWMESYFNREGDYYFIIELISGIKTGAISIYDVKDESANWGRWIIDKAYPVAPASAWLMYSIAFNVLGLSSVCSNTVIDNKQTVSFHDRCGIPRIRIESKALTIGGTAYDTVIHQATRELWPDRKSVV